MTTYRVPEAGSSSYYLPAKPSEEDNILKSLLDIDSTNILKNDLDSANITSEDNIVKRILDRANMTQEDISKALQEQQEQQDK